MFYLVLGGMSEKKLQTFPQSASARNGSYTVSEIAEFLSVSDATVRQWVNRGRLRACKFPGSGNQSIIRVLRPDYDDFLKNYKKPMKFVLFATAKYQRVSRLVQSVHTGHYRVCRFKGFTTPEENGRWTFRVTLSSVSGILNKISQGGETGRRTGLKIRSSLQKPQQNRIKCG